MGRVRVVASEGRLFCMRSCKWTVNSEDVDTRVSALKLPRRHGPRLLQVKPRKPPRANIRERRRSKHPVLLSSMTTMTAQSTTRPCGHTFSADTRASKYVHYIKIYTVEDLIIKACWSQLLHGSFTSVLSTLGQQALELQLERFFTIWAWKWDFEDEDFGSHLGMSCCV